MQCCRLISHDKLKEAGLEVDAPRLYSPACTARHLMLFAALHSAHAVAADKSPVACAGVHYVRALSAFEWARAIHPTCWRQVWWFLCCA